jgi:hypothetical protein
MLMENLAPEEKLTPFAWRMALSLKLRVPEGSLGGMDKDEGGCARRKNDIHYSRKVCERRVELEGTPRQG